MRQMVVQAVPEPPSDYPAKEESEGPTMPAETNSGGGGGAPRASLLCRPNSHPFQDRMLALDQPVKVGRSVARARPVQTNAIFDCKVLSRNHALLWYENGKFYLQDTKSSNGTFVNNQRLSKGSEESPPREVCSGDILQFGVDVMENSRKVTHGCIIATLKLFLPDGKEAKASPSIVNTSPGTAIPAQDLYQLNQYIQEALAREQLLENKLLTLQRLVGDTEVATNQGWKALMDEDRLLTRVEILESQLTTYGKSMTEDKLREETKRLMGDKESYQNTAKDTLKRLMDEKLDSSKKLKEVETSLGNLEEEYSSLNQLYEKVVEDNKKLSEKITSISEELIKKTKDENSEMNDINDSQTEIKKTELYIENDVFGENGTGGTNGKYCEDETDLDKTSNELGIMQGSTDSLDGTKPEDLDEDDEDDDDDDEVLENNKKADLSRLLEEDRRLREQLEKLKQCKGQTDNEMVNLKINLEEAKNENATILQELENTRNKLLDADKLISSQDQLVRDLEEKVEGNLGSNSFSISAEKHADNYSVPHNNRAILSGAVQHSTSSEDSVTAVPSSSSVNSSVSADSLSPSSETSEECNRLRARVDELERENKTMQAKLGQKDQQLTLQRPICIEGLGPPLASSPLKDAGQEVQEVSGPALHIVQDKDHVASSSPHVANLSSSLPVSGTRDSLNLSSSSVASEVSILEQSLEEAESKIASLLKVKEKLVIVQTEKCQLEVDVSGLEEELSILSSVSRGMTACTLGPLLVLLVAMVVAFLPSFSSILGTRDV